MILKNLSMASQATHRRRSTPRSGQHGVAVFLTFLSLGSSGFAETAYSALRVVSAKRGEDVLHRVIEVRGEGKREPTAWKIVLADPRAKAGVREFKVVNGRITSDRVPAIPRSASVPMDLTLLNVDSEGVIAMVDQQTKAATGTARISYTLSNAMETGAPVWVVKLYPSRKVPPASMEIAADTGEILGNTLLQVADDSQLSSGGEAPIGAEVGVPKQTEVEDGLVNSAGGAREMPSPPHTREDVAAVPRIAKSLVRRATKPLRLLRQFLP